MTGRVVCGLLGRYCERQEGESTEACIKRIRSGQSERGFENYLRWVKHLGAEEARRVAHIPDGNMTVETVGELLMTDLCPRTVGK